MFQFIGVISYHDPMPYTALGQAFPYIPPLQSINLHPESSGL